MKTILLAIALASTLISGATAQTYDPSPRDPAFGKGNADNDTFHRPSQADIGSWGRAYGSTSYGETTRSVRRPDHR